MIYLQIIICAAAALLIINMLLLAPGRFPKRVNTQLWRTLYAHRGLHSKDKSVPENSMAAFAAAVENGYGIELDVNITTDGQVVVFHDDDLKRICGVDKRLIDCSYEELSSYTLLDTQEKIPLFSDVLQLVTGRHALVVELKTSSRRNELCEKTAALLDSYTGPYCIESFDPRIVNWFKKNRPQTVRGQLSAALRSFKGQPLVQSFLLASLYTNIVSRPHFVAFRHEDILWLKLGLYRLLGGRLVGWTVRDTDDAPRLSRYFDAIIFEFFRPAAKL